MYDALIQWIFKRFSKIGEPTKTIYPHQTSRCAQRNKKRAKKNRKKKKENRKKRGSAGNPRLRGISASLKPSPPFFLLRSLWFPTSSFRNAGAPKHRIRLLELYGLDAIHVPHGHRFSTVRSQSPLPPPSRSHRFGNLLSPFRCSSINLWCGFNYHLVFEWKSDRGWRVSDRFSSHELLPEVKFICPNFTKAIHMLSYLSSMELSGFSIGNYPFVFDDSQYRASFAWIRLFRRIWLGWHGLSSILNPNGISLLCDCTENY